MFDCSEILQRQIGYTKPDENGGSNNLQVDASPGDEGCADMNMSYISTNSIEICSPDRIDMPNGWEAPAPAVQPVLPLRLYVPDLEEIRISPVVARRGRQTYTVYLTVASDMNRRNSLAFCLLYCYRIPECIGTWWLWMEKALGCKYQ